MTALGLALHVDYLNASQASELALLAETRGFDSVWVPETWGRDAVSLLTHLAISTSRIKLATGISPIWGRTPALLAQTIASLDEISGGRMIAGLGVSAPKVAQDWHGHEWRQPLQRTREYVAILRLALSGQRVNFEGEVFRLKDFALGFKPPRQSVPIYIASLAEENIRLTGEIADGWLPFFPSLTALPRFRALLDEGGRRAGKAGWEGSIAAVATASVTGDVERDRKLLRSHIAMYVGGMGTFYGRLVRSYGFADEAAAIESEWRAGRRDGAAAAIPDAMLDELTISGPPEAARARIATFQDAGVTPVLAPAKGLSVAEMAATIEAVS